MVFTLKIEQNGGEYYGLAKIKGKTIEKVNGKTVVVDSVVISFDEYVEVISIKESDE